jgi:hypothetical protein
MSKLSWCISANVAWIALLAVAGPALAQDAPSPPDDRGYWMQPGPAPSRALELTLGTGYTQGFGQLHAVSDVSDQIGAGVSTEFGAGYRLDPRWMFGMSAAYQFYSAGDALGGEVGPAELWFASAPRTTSIPTAASIRGCRPTSGTAMSANATIPSLAPNHACTASSFWGSWLESTCGSRLVSP